jgi:hypothetical protein
VLGRPSAVFTRSAARGNEQAGPPERRSNYELHLPNTIVLRLGWGGERGMVYFFASQPESAERCAGYVVIGRNYNLDQSDRVLQEFEDTIFGQDQPSGATTDSLACCSQGRTPNGR